MRTAAIYARKSTEQTSVADESKSVTRQVEHARAYATAKGWTVVDEYVYVDDAISGAEFQNRPGYMRLLNALKPRAPFQVLIVSELSRLGRRGRHSGRDRGAAPVPRQGRQEARGAPGRPKEA